MNLIQEKNYFEPPDDFDYSDVVRPRSSPLISEFKAKINVLMFGQHLAKIKLI